MRLRTFGGLWIESGASPAPSDLRPRWLALLGILAAAGAKGVSRERLLGILWPDTDEERARHALSQTLYSLRRDLGVQPVLLSGDLRLDSAVITSDLGEFSTAIGRGHHLQALDLYAGPFLEGFYLEEAPEFERWVEEERARLARTALETAVALANERSTAGDAAGAADAWRRTTLLDPLSSRYALAYMTALAGAGDRAGALGHAREYEATVRRELEAAPDAEVLGLAERLRRAPPKSAPPAEPAAISPPEVVIEQPVPSRPSPAHRRHWALWLTGAAAVGVLAIAARSAWSGGDGALPPILAVGHLRDAPRPDTSNLSGVLTDMLATNLGRVRGLEVVANSRLFELMRPGEDTLRGAFSAAARRAGARQILEGEVSLAPEGGFKLDLRRIDLKTGVVRQGYRVQALDRYALVDSATAAVARDFNVDAPGGAIAEVSTASPLAYRLYEEGLRSYYQYDVAAALRLMQAALQEDSTFAIAAFYAWLSSGRPLDGPGREYFDRAIRLAPSAPDRERLLILGSVLGRSESPEVVAYAESLTIRFPTDPEGQMMLGEVLNSVGDYPAAVVALNRAVALDSSANAIGGESCRACQSLYQMSWGYIVWDSFPAAERTVKRWIRFAPRKVAPLEMRVEILARTGRWNEVNAALARIDSIEPLHFNDRQMALYHFIRRGDYDSLQRPALQILQETNRELRIDAVWLWIIALRNQGRLSAATDLMRGRLPGGVQLDPSLIDPQPIAAATVAFESGQYQTATRMYSSLVFQNSSNPFPGHRARGMSWTLTLEATARAAAGDTSAIRRLADSIETIGRRSLNGRSSHLHHFVRGLLLAREGRHTEAVDAYRRAIVSWDDGYTRINYELARSLLALQRFGEAVYPLQAALRGAIDASNLYITRTELHELLAQTFSAGQQRDSAAAHYREVVRAWEKGDPPFQARRQAALDWLARNAR